MANIYVPPQSVDVNLPSFLIDLFGRLRTSDPIIILQISQSDAITPLVITEGQVSGSDTSSNFSAVTASTTLTVGASDGLRRLRTRVPGMYQAGKSLLYLYTFNLIASGDLAFVLRSSVTGSVVETAVTQANWNVDKFDGSGASKVNLDQTKCHIGFIGFEWLGVGDVVCGFIHNRLPSVAHIFKHANALENVYMKSANLFPTWEIQKASTTITKRLGYFDDNDGVYLRQTGGGSNLRVICCSLINEGAIDKSGATYSITRNIGDTYNTGTINTARAILLFRLNPNNITSRVLVTGVEVVVATACNYYLSLCRQPTFSTTVTPSWTSLTNRSIQYDPDPASTSAAVTNVSTSSIWTSTGSAGKGTINSSSFAVNSIDYLGSEYNNEPELWALVIQCDVINVDVSTAVVSFIEEI